MKKITAKILSLISNGTKKNKINSIKKNIFFIINIIQIKKMKTHHS